MSPDLTSASEIHKEGSRFVAELQLNPVSSCETLLEPHPPGGIKWLPADYWGGYWTYHECQGGISGDPAHEELQFITNERKTGITASHQTFLSEDPLFLQNYTFADLGLRTTALSMMADFAEFDSDFSSQLYHNKQDFKSL